MCWLHGDDPGDLLHRSRHVNALLGDGFAPSDCVDTFKYGAGQDLTGYEDGTENPTGQDAVDAAFVSGKGPGLDGSSFVASQQWLHDFDAFAALTTSEADNSVGRRLSDNVELEDAPASAHVKRTAQESFDPEAFLLRRSMPWSIPEEEGGLFFVAFGKSFDVFEAQLARMIGDEDGIADALFQFTRPLAGTTVIEIAALGPAPICGMILADFGAKAVQKSDGNPSVRGILYNMCVVHFEFPSVGLPFYWAITSLSERIIGANRC